MNRRSSMPVQRGTKRYVNLAKQDPGRPGRAVKQEQEQNSRNHVQAFLLVSELGCEQRESETANDVYTVANLGQSSQL